MTKEEQYLEYFSFKKINEWKKVEEEERGTTDLSAKEAKEKFKNIANYIGYKIKISDKEANELSRKLSYEIKNIQAIYKIYSKNRANGFNDFKFFYNWYNKQDRKCYYCGIDEHKVADLFEKKILKSKRRRGDRLEIDKKDPNGLYSEENCVLSCYFCNNDKSDIFDDIEYVKFFQNRKKYLEDLLVHKV